MGAYIKGLKFLYRVAQNGCLFYYQKLRNDLQYYMGTLTRYNISQEEYPTSLITILQTPISQLICHPQTGNPHLPWLFMSYHWHVRYHRTGGCGGGGLQQRSGALERRRGESKFYSTVKQEAGRKRFYSLVSFSLRLVDLHVGLTGKEGEKGEIKPDHGLIVQDSFCEKDATRPVLSVMDTTAT